MQKKNGGIRFPAVFQVNELATCKQDSKEII